MTQTVTAIHKTKRGIHLIHSLSTFLMLLMMQGCGNSTSFLPLQNPPGDVTPPPDQVSPVDSQLTVQRSDQLNFSQWLTFPILQESQNSTISLQAVNTGSQAIRILGPILDNNPDNLFNIVDKNNCLNANQEIAPKKYCEFDLVFMSPSAVTKTQKFTSELFILFQKAEQKPVAEELISNIVRPKATVMAGQSSDPSDDIPPTIDFAQVEAGDAIDFGSHPVGSKIRKKVELSKQGKGEIAILGWQLEDGKNFQISHFPCHSMEDTDLFCYFELSYDAKPAGEHSDRLIITYNNGEMTSQIAVNMTGLATTNGESCIERYDEVLLPLAEVDPSVPGHYPNQFPYLSESNQTNSTLDKLYWTQTNWSQSGFHGVYDAQVFITFPVPRKMDKIVDMMFRFDVKKVAEDTEHAFTEMLCLMIADYRTCSGYKFIYPSWRALENPVFWDESTSAHNILYSEDFADFIFERDKVIEITPDLSIYHYKNSLSIHNFYGFDFLSSMQKATANFFHFVFVDDMALGPRTHITVTRERKCQ